jgi:hypothetical protein
MWWSMTWSGVVGQVEWMDGGGQGAVDGDDDLERVERDRNKKQNNNKNNKAGLVAVKRVRPAAALVLAAGLTSYMICKWRFLDRQA